MGFTTPRPPPFDLDEWRAKPYLARLKANAQDWAVNGFGTPDGGLPALRGQARRLRRRRVRADRRDHARASAGSVTSPTGGPSRSCSRSSSCGRCSGRSSGSARARCRWRFASCRRSAACLYWLRTGHGPAAAVARPGPADRRARGARRSMSLLYAGVLAAALYLLIGGDEPVGGLAAGRLEPGAIAVLLGLWALLGLRDKVSFLAGAPGDLRPPARRSRCSRSRT